MTHGTGVDPTVTPTPVQLAPLPPPILSDIATGIPTPHFHTPPLPPPQLHHHPALGGGDNPGDEDIDDDVSKLDMDVDNDAPNLPPLQSRVYIIAYPDDDVAHDSEPTPDGIWTSSDFNETAPGLSFIDSQFDPPLHCPVYNACGLLYWGGSRYISDHGPFHF